MTIATSANAARNGSGIPATARATRRSNGVCPTGRRQDVRRDPRRRFGMPPYRSHVPGADSSDPTADPPGYVVLVEPGDRIHFLDWGGSGAPGVVLVHGLAGSAWRWAPIARRLIGVRRTAALDLRGHGLSDAPTETGAYALEVLAGDIVAVADGSGALGGDG